MPSLVYNSYFDDAARNNINVAVDTFKGMLVTSTYVADKDAHLKRSSVTNEVAGTGYTAGGQTVAMTVTKDLTNDRLDVAIGAPAGWTGSTITARAMVVYKSRGGVATADELVAYVDFGGTVSSTAATFTFTPTGSIKFQN